MYTVYNSQGVKMCTTEDEVQADFFAWMYDGYFEYSSTKF